MVSKKMFAFALTDGGEILAVSRTPAECCCDCVNSGSTIPKRNKQAAGEWNKLLGRAVIEREHRRGKRHRLKYRDGRTVPQRGLGEEQSPANHMQNILMLSEPRHEANTGRAFEPPGEPMKDAVLGARSDDRESCVVAVAREFGKGLDQQVESFPMHYPPHRYDREAVFGDVGPGIAIITRRRARVALSYTSEEHRV